MAQMANCVAHVEAWMAWNRLRLNPAKTEVMSGLDLLAVWCNALLILCSSSSPVPPSYRSLVSVTLELLSTNVTSVCFFHFRQLRLVRRSLTTDTAHALVRALIHSRLDYYNGVRYYQGCQSVCPIAPSLFSEPPPDSSSAYQAVHR